MFGVEEGVVQHGLDGDGLVCVEGGDEGCVRVLFV